MRLACQESRALSEYARASINALNICFVHSSLSSSAQKLRSKTCRGVAGKDTGCLTSSSGDVFSASLFQTDAPWLPASEVHSKAGRFRCSAMSESNGVWTTKGSSSSPDCPPDRQWNGRDSWSVHKPLQVPLEDAIRHGNWLEARGLVDKLLSVGTVQDISSLEKLIKGAYSRHCKDIARVLEAERFHCLTCFQSDWENVAGLCNYGQFQTGWRLFKSCVEAYHPLGYSTYQTMIASAFKVCVMTAHLPTCALRHVPPCLWCFCWSLSAFFRSAISVHPSDLRTATRNGGDEQDVG